MRTMFIVSASLMAYPKAEVSDAVEIAIREMIRRDDPQPIILCPDGLDLPVYGNGAVRYGAKLGMEAGYVIWAPFAGVAFDRLTVFGSTPLADFEEIAIACFCKAESKSYRDARGGAFDVGFWERDIRPNYGHRPVTIRRLDEGGQTDYIRRVHAWLSAELAASRFGRPQALLDRRPEISLYREHRLARDLAQLTIGLQLEAHEAAFSILKTPDGAIVQCADYHRAFANFVTSIDGVETVLEVGCGSGLLSCHLAGSGNYRSVVGVDSSTTRIESATLHAGLVGSAARFSQSSMASLDFPDKSVDLVVTSYALEQSGAQLASVVRELCRVARKYVVLFEPTGQYFSTMPGIWHIEISGWANSYFTALSGLNYAARPNLLCQYYNPSAVFVIDLAGRENPTVSLPHLFDPKIENWPGGVRFE